MAKKSMKKGGCWSGGCSGGRRRRTMRGGVYGFSGEVIAPGTLVESAPYTGPVNSSGTPIPDPTDPKGGYTGLGGRRGSRKGRRGSRKTRRVSRKTRRGARKMRGGASQMSMGGVGYGYTGTGAGGLADATQYVKPGNPI